MLFPRRDRLAVALATLLPTLASLPAAAQGTGDIAVEQAWARATPHGAQVAGAYVTIINRGTAPDTLTGGSAEVAGRFELHDMTMVNGVMGMRPTGPLPIPPGATVTLSPRGRHIMLSDLKRGLAKGETVQGTLTFARAGTVPVRFAVEGIGAMAPASGDAMAPTAEHAMPGMKMD